MTVSLRRYRSDTVIDTPSRAAVHGYTWILASRITQKPYGDLGVFGCLRSLANVAEQGDGAQGRNRTTDTAIFSRMLYQLSYLGSGATEGALL